MSPETASLVWLAKVAMASFAGGVVGSISGLGGGIIIVPVLTVFLHIPIQEAIGASVVSVIAVSSGAGSVYLRDRITNVRIAMFLELFTAAGALIGASILSRFANPQSLSILFGLTLLLSLIPVLVHIGEELPQGVRNDAMATFLRLNGSYFDKRRGQEVQYNVKGIPAASAMMLAAGQSADRMAHDPFAYHPRVILDGIHHGSGKAIIEVGIYLLVLTPITRVFMSAVLFAVERDWLYAFMTLLVLILTLAGLLFLK